jgi:hypothetical protein
MKKQRGWSLSRRWKMSLRMKNRQESWQSKCWKKPGQKTKLQGWGWMKQRSWTR